MSACVVDEEGTEVVVELLGNVFAFGPHLLHAHRAKTQPKPVFVSVFCLYVVFLPELLRRLSVCPGVASSAAGRLRTAKFNICTTLIIPANPLSILCAQPELCRHFSYI